MITIYSIEGIEYLPRKIIGRPLEDCREWQLAINFVRWLALELADLTRSPIQLAVFYAVMVWPVNLYG